MGRCLLQYNFILKELTNGKWLMSGKKKILRLPNKKLSKSAPSPFTSRYAYAHIRASLTIRISVKNSLKN
jgi:hypothetical protein